MRRVFTSRPIRPLLAASTAAAALGVIALFGACGFGVNLDGLADGGSPDGTKADGPVGDGSAPDSPIGPFVPATQITAGGGSTCALRKDGTVACWGGSDSGRLGDGKGIDTSAPSLVVGLGDATQISSGDAHVCAVRASGAVVCWGYNNNGQIGDGTQNEADTPKPVSTLTDATAVAGGVNFTCALKKDATVACWGNNDAGQLGDGTTSKHLTPAPVVGVSGVKSIAAGGYHVCALAGSGDVWCWGHNDNGQVGVDTKGADVTMPTKVAGVSGATAIGAGRDHSCAVSASGQVQCWGYGDSGQLGNSSNGTSATPVNVFSLSDATALGLGGGHSCAAQKSGGVSCWGANDWGQLGTGDTSIGSINVPAAVGKVAGIVEVTAGYVHTCGRTADGHVFCWGSDIAGRLGTGRPVYAPSPVMVAGATNVSMVAVGGDPFACALDMSGGMKCWGNNDNGELAQNKIHGGGTPLPIMLGTSITPSTMVAGGAHLCIAGAGTDVVCWGYNQYGQLASGDQNGSSSGVVFGGSGFGGTPTSLGYTHTCVTLGDGGLACAGANGSGQLGNGSTTYAQTTPVSANLPLPVAVANAGANHTCAVTSDGTAYCWGTDNYGELGNGNGSTSTPAPIVGLDAGVAQQFSMGYGHTCALLMDGSVYCFGNNSGGQLGNGSTNGTSTPSLVKLPKAATRIASGDGHSCALLSDGSIMCWGYGDRGQMGNGMMANALSPVAVSGVSGATAIAAGGNETCAVLGDHSVTCWGQNDWGQIGDGAVIVVASAKAVTGF